MYGEESVYNLVPPEAVVHQRPPMYRSTHHGASKPTASMFGLANAQQVANLAGDSNYDIEQGTGAHSTFGRPLCSALPNPQNFLKADSIELTKKIMEPNVNSTRPKKEKLKPALPSKDDKPIMNLVSSKNYIVANAVEAILAAPKKTPAGDEDFMGKEDFGKVPAYLHKIKSDIEAEYDYIRKLREEDEASKEGMRDLTQGEKDHLLAGLKAKWEQVNHDYQMQTHLTKLDTVGKIARKERNETALTQIEKDIDQVKRQNLKIDLTR